MMDDPLDDLDQILDDADRSAQKPKNAKQGRRAGGGPVPPQESLSGQSANPEMIPEDKSADAPPKRAKRTGGWGEEKRGGSIPDIEDERLKMRTPSPDGEADIPVIPNLEDQHDDEVSLTIAMAPTVAVNRVATYRELDNDLLSHAQFMTLDNEVDLKLLGRCLSNEVDIKEEDKPWDWDRLFTEVTSELLTEWAGEEKKEDEQEPIGIPA